MVGIAQLVSAPDCGSGGQGFESLYPPLNLMGYRQAVRHSTLTAALVGSNPTSPVRAVDKNCSIKYGALAQSVEHLTFNQVVRGSNPRCFTKEKRKTIWFSAFLPFRHHLDHLFLALWILAKVPQNYLLFLEELEL